MQLRKFSLTQTYARGDEPPPTTFDLDLELRFNNINDASQFHQQLVVLINQSINPKPSMDEFLRSKLKGE